MAACPSKTLEWFRLKLTKLARSDTDTLYDVMEAGFPTVIFIWFGQNSISACADWTCKQYVSCMKEVCRLLRRCAYDCVSVLLNVRVRAAIRNMRGLASWSLDHGVDQKRLTRSGSER